MLYWLCCWCDELFRWFSLLLSWPVVALVMFIIVICGFKQNLRALIDRLKSISTKYGSATFVAPKEIAQSLGAVFPKAPIQSDTNTASVVADMMRRAQQLIESKENEKAIDLLLRINQIMPNQWVVLHNLGVLLIRLGKATKKTELLVQAEMTCKQAIYLEKTFPYGTMYNMARAQAASGNTEGLKETLAMLANVKLPSNLAKALVDGDRDFEDYEGVKDLKEYKNLRSKLMIKRNGKELTRDHDAEFLQDLVEQLKNLCKMAENAGNVLKQKDKTGRISAVGGKIIDDFVDQMRKFIDEL